MPAPAAGPISVIREMLLFAARRNFCFGVSGLLLTARLANIRDPPDSKLTTGTPASGSALCSYSFGACHLDEGASGVGLADTNCCATKALQDSNARIIRATAGWTRDCRESVRIRAQVTTWLNIKLPLTCRGRRPTQTDTTTLVIRNLSWIGQPKLGWLNPWRVCDPQRPACRECAAIICRVGLARCWLWVWSLELSSAQRSIRVRLPTPAVHGLSHCVPDYVDPLNVVVHY